MIGKGRSIGRLDLKLVLMALAWTLINLYACELTKLGGLMLTSNAPVEF